MEMLFTHAMRAVVHALMAREAERIYDLHFEEGTATLRSSEECAALIAGLTPFERCSLDMLSWWHTHDKHFVDLHYVWLPTSGQLPEPEPELGQDCYVPLDQSKRRKGGVLGRLARLQREFDGDTLH
jgi:hypothetical protein